jgi:hypothetical protein
LSNYVNKVTEIETVLSADDMQGRRAFTLEGLIKASAYIESLFKKIGLETFDGATGKQEFAMTESKQTLKYKLMD